MEIAFAALCGLVGGVLLSVFVAASILRSEDNDTEKRGVWMNKDRAYRLTRLDASQ